ncbi:unnamed protein product [Ixodes pacificus]
MAEEEFIFPISNNGWHYLSIYSNLRCACVLVPQSLDGLYARCLWTFQYRNRCLMWILLCALAFTAVLYCLFNLSVKPPPPYVASCTPFPCHHASAPRMYKRQTMRITREHYRKIRDGQLGPIPVLFEVPCQSVCVFCALSQALMLIAVFTVPGDCSFSIGTHHLYKRCTLSLCHFGLKQLTRRSYPRQ